MFGSGVNMVSEARQYLFAGIELYREQKDLGAIACFEKSFALNDWAAGVNLDILYPESSGVRGHRRQHIDLSIEKLAEEGNSWGEYLLAVKKEAIARRGRVWQWRKRKNEIGCLRRFIENSPKTIKESPGFLAQEMECSPIHLTTDVALDLYRRAADHENILAQYLLGVFYADGVYVGDAPPLGAGEDVIKDADVRQDVDSAIMWFNRVLEHPLIECFPGLWCEITYRIASMNEDGVIHTLREDELFDKYLSVVDHGDVGLIYDREPKDIPISEGILITSCLENTIQPHRWDGEGGVVGPWAELAGARAVQIYKERRFCSCKRFGDAAFDEKKIVELIDFTCYAWNAPPACDVGPDDDEWEWPPEVIPGLRHHWFSGNFYPEAESPLI